MMANSKSCTRSISPHSSLTTPTPDPCVAQRERSGVEDGLSARLDENCFPASSYAQNVRTGALSSPQSPAQPQRFQAPAATGRIRGKSISLATITNTPGITLTVPSINPTDTASDNTSTQTHLTVPREGVHTPSPSYQQPSITLMHSPISPHRAKPRRKIAAEFCSDSPTSSDNDYCTARAHAELGSHRHTDGDCGTEDFSTDADSSKTESDPGITELETASAAGSTLTEAGCSAPEDSISECSNSDVEIYLEAQGLGDSAMRMNCVGSSSVTEGDASKPPAASPFRSVSATTPGMPENDKHTLRPTYNTIDQGGNDWVTKPDVEGRASTNDHVYDQRNATVKEGISPMVQSGESITRVQVQASDHDGTTKASHIPTGDYHGDNHALRGQTKTIKAVTPSQAALSKTARTSSDLNPTSVDFKPRMGIELKPPLVEFKPSGIEFKPPQIEFTPNLPYPTVTRLLPPECGQSQDLHTAPNHPPRTSLSQQDSNQFQSNRANINPSYIPQSNSTTCPDDTVYLEKLQPHTDSSQATYASTSDYQASEDHSQHNEGSQYLDDSQKTPNVYINGLPPHFPEGQLFALAAPFGEVKSVRTFTRHVRDSESGYGFVLFETIDAAERCIIALRKYRNLHPTFSKQIHKIPGTIYAQSFAQASESMNSVNSWDSKRDESDSFKRRMESLHDPTSTNLYMEGLPLSIDEPTLAALVSPHRISSSRFFQTRLSHPPRIIAFVRLETRAGAEEIIERLHGRMVRGWNDTGSRISVRFADTAEQRELRKRTERAAKEGDLTSSKLTIAQAALLNLRGQELRQATLGTLPVIGERRNLNVTDASYNELPSNALQLPLSQMSRPFEVDYTLAPGRAVPHITVPTSTNNPISQTYNRPLPRNVEPTLPLAMDQMRSNATTFRSAQATYDSYLQQSVTLPNQQYASEDYSVRPGPANAHTGYTATEEFIMRAHVDARRRHGPLDATAPVRSRRDCDPETTAANISTGVRGYRARGAAVSLDRRNQHTTLAEIEPMNEDEFHTAVARGQGDQLHLHNEQDPDATVGSMGQDYNARTNNGSALRPGSRTVHTPIVAAQSQFGSTNIAEQHHHQHVRCTTFPYRPTPTQYQRHQQHNSMSMPAISQRTPQHASTAVMGQGLNNFGQDSDGLDKHSGRRDHLTNKLHSKLQHNNMSLHQSTYDMDSQPSPSLISPTLTYSSQTPSTLSPATPFFGSFGSQNDGFDRASNTVEGKKLKGMGH